MDLRLPKEHVERYGLDALWVVDALCTYVWERSLTDAERMTRLKTLTPGQRAILPTASVHGDVLNGGFRQYFHNDGALFAMRQLRASS